MNILFVAVLAEENNAYSDDINDKLSTPPSRLFEPFELLDDLPLPDLPLDDDPVLLEPDFPLLPLLVVRVLPLDVVLVVGRALGTKVASRSSPSSSPPLLPRADGRLVRRDDDGTDVMVGLKVVPESIGSFVVGSIAVGSIVVVVVVACAIGDGVGEITTEEAIGDGVGRVPSKEFSGNELSVVKFCAVTIKE
jgi:hypothetical protein